MRNLVSSVCPKGRNRTGCVPKHTLLHPTYNSPTDDCTVGQARKAEEGVEAVHDLFRTDAEHGRLLLTELEQLDDLGGCERTKDSRLHCGDEFDDPLMHHRLLLGV